MLGDRHPKPPDTLGYVYAVDGRFRDAEREAERALRLARRTGDAELIKGIERLLVSYRAMIARGDAG